MQRTAFVTALFAFGALTPSCASGNEIELHPDFPVVSGQYQLTEEWYLALPGSFNRRIEDGNMVIWRPGITLWISVWNNDHEQSVAERLNRIRADTSPSAFAISISVESKPARYSYRMNETESGSIVYAVYGFVLSEHSHVQMAVYVNEEADVPTAEKIVQSIRTPAV